MSIDLPLGYVLTLVDMYLLDGYISLIRVALAILKLLEPKLLTYLTMEDASEVLKVPMNHIKCNKREFFRVACSFKISK